MHSNIYKPLGVADVFYFLVFKGNLNLKEQNRKGSVAKLPNNASGQRLCPSTLLSL